MNNVGRTASKNWLSLVLIFLLTFSVSLAGGRFVRSILVGNHANNSSETTDDINANSGNNLAQSSNNPTNTIELQPIIDSWAASLSGEVGVVVYDLDRNEIAAEYNADKVFLTDNLRGLLLAYDGYRQIDAGVEKANTSVINTTTYSECLETMVRTDDIICSEAILFDPERSTRVESLISELGMAQTTEFGQSSTANDYLKLLQSLWAHRDLSLDSWAKLQDFMLEPSSENTVDWRQSLPSGFSTAKVYSKASGTQNMDAWERYADLALVDFVKHGRKFAVVVLSKNVSDVSSFSRLGTLIEGKVIEE